MRDLTPSSTNVVIGVDIGDTRSAICVMSSPESVLLRDSVKTTPEDVRKRFAKFAASRVVIETGSHTLWLSELLRDLGHEVVIVDPSDPRVKTNRNKTDRKDAEKLAKVGWLPKGFVRTVRYRPMERQRDLVELRTRHELVGSRTALINAVRGTVKQFGVRVPSCDTDNFIEKALLALPKQLRKIVIPLLKLIRAANQEIARHEARLARLAKRYPVTKHLESVYGVGPTTALAYALTIQDPRRFTKSRRVGAYLGLTPLVRESGDGKPQLSISKAGDEQLRSLLVNCAHTVLRERAEDSDLKRFGLALCQRGGKNAKKRAVVAVARRLAVLLHRIWITGEEYDPFYVDKRRRQQLAVSA